MDLIASCFEYISKMCWSIIVKSEGLRDFNFCKADILTFVKDTFLRNSVSLADCHVKLSVLDLKTSIKKLERKRFSFWKPVVSYLSYGAIVDDRNSFLQIIFLKGQV